LYLITKHPQQTTAQRRTAQLGGTLPTELQAVGRPHQPDNTSA